MVTSFIIAARGPLRLVLRAPWEFATHWLRTQRLDNVGNVLGRFRFTLVLRDSSIAERVASVVAVMASSFWRQLQQVRVFI